MTNGNARAGRSGSRYIEKGEHSLRSVSSSNWGSKIMPSIMGLLRTALVPVALGCASVPAVAQPLEIQPEQATSWGWAARFATTAKSHMVAAAHPLAVEAGLRMLRAGGSAADAAIAVQLVLNLVEPQPSGLGGGAFALHWDAGRKE